MINIIVLFRLAVLRNTDGLKRTIRELAEQKELFNDFKEKPCYLPGTLNPYFPPTTETFEIKTPTLPPPRSKFLMPMRLPFIS